MADSAAVEPSEWGARTAATIRITHEPGFVRRFWEATRFSLDTYLNVVFDVLA